MRVVFDTNILVSAFEFPEGRAAQALPKIRDYIDNLFISQPIIDELLRVLTQKFGRSHAELAELRIFLAKYGELVAPTQTLAVLADEPDNRILECALAANAPIIVTGDRAMLALGEIGNIRISSLSTYLDVVLLDRQRHPGLVQ